MAKTLFRRNNRLELANYLYVTPALILVLGFIIAPIIFVIITSFTNWDIIRPMEFVGIKNYITFFQDPIVLRSLKNTFMVVALVLAIPMIAGLLLAVFIRNVWFSRGFKSIFYIPLAMSGAGIGIIWQWIYSRSGFVNGILTNLGILDQPRSYLIQVPLNVILIIFSIAWQSTGINMILFLMGLQNIPSEVLEAAKIDGASAFQELTHLTLPLLKPVFLIVCFLSLLWTMGDFVTVYMMTGGGPIDRTLTAPVAAYKIALVRQISLSHVLIPSSYCQYI